MFNSDIVKGTDGEFVRVVDHPARHGGVEHHQKIRARQTEPSVDMPLGSLGLELLVRLDDAQSAASAERQLHRQNRDAHDRQKQQVDQYEKAAAVLTRNVGEFPHIADADRTARAD